MENYSEGLATGMALSQDNRYPYPYWGMGNNNGGFGFGGEWGGLIGLLIVASLFGGNGWGFGGNRGGNCATQADLSAGFANSEIMSDLNDILLQNSQGFAGVQQTLCQGFSGVNATVNQGFAGVNNAICTLGYQNAQLANGISRELADCCCKLERGIDSVNFNAERNACDIKSAIFNSTRDIIDSQRCGTDRILGFLTNQEMDRLRSRVQTLEFEKSQANQNAYIAANQDAQTAELLRRLGRDCPTPAYIVPNPNCCYDYRVNGVGYGNTGCCGNGGF
jgi:hypothetical protein